MGDMKAQARGASSSSDADGADPFSDLADLFETEVERIGARADFDAAFEDEFADALAMDVARDLASHSPAPKAANSAQQSWVAPRPVRLADPREDRGAYGMAVSGVGQRSALSLQADLEQALRGLSSPANPRQPIIVETQSFAPERVVDEPIEDLSEPELDDFDKLIASELAVLHRNEMPRVSALPLSGAAARRPLPSGVDYTVAIEDGDPSGSYDEIDGEQPRRRRGLVSRGMVMLGGGVAALALVGAIGFALLSSGHGTLEVASGDPLLIKADTVPFKMVPKDPGGRSIPNQNKAVYDRVAAPSGEVVPQQSALLTDAEELIELPAESEDESSRYVDNLPGVELAEHTSLELKNETRVESDAAHTNDSSDIPVLEPRKVRTMAVRPDGTLVPASMPTPAPMRTASVEPAPTPAPADATLSPMPIPGAVTMASVEAPQEPASAPAAAAIEPEPELQSAPTVQAEAPAPAADPVQVAAIERAPAPAPVPAAAAPLPAGGYYVQISSQPSEALAKASLQNLGSRFAQVIDGRSVGIQAAEIPGKGTFYRVRVAAESKSEAGSLCNRLKAAGGNCFVAR